MKLNTTGALTIYETEPSDRPTDGRPDSFMDRHYTTRPRQASKLMLLECHACLQRVERCMAHVQLQ